MKNPIATRSRFNIFRAHAYRILKRPYLVVSLTSYTLVGLLVTLYLMKTPVYTSNMELVLPGTGNSSSVSLNGIGQIVSKTDTPFAGGGFNPRINYKEMLSSRRIVDGAAASLNISSKDFGKAKVKLTEQTSIILLTVKGKSRSMAQAKALALYESLQQELDNLRADEVLRRDQSIQSTLKQYQIRMDITRNAIIDFQQSSMLVSDSQLEQLILTLASLKERKIYARADAKKLKAYVKQLSKELGVSPKLAGQAFALQSDVAFRAYSQELEKSITKLTEYSSRWGVNHPKVIAQQKRLNLTRSSINKRSRKLFGVKTAAIFSNLNLEATPKRSKLFADLIDAYANYKGQVSMLEDLASSIKRLSINLKICSSEIIELENRQRKFNMAEAIYTSAAARIEASRADIFASYPVIQMLANPSYPELHSSPNKMIALAAAIAGFSLITFGLFLI
ncbi:MAG: hypothetical protein ACI9ES_001219 [Oceanospirillaceae bacterium]|jgi:uncharacterized protein involved in exopolysaccharide biosynthesis